MTRSELRGLLQDIRGELALAADATYRAQIERLVPGIRTVGVRVPDLRAIAKWVLKGEPRPTFEATCGLCDELCASGVRDEMLVGLFVIAAQKRALVGLDWQRVEKWLGAVDNWETCDQLAMGVGAPMVATNSSWVDRLVRLAGSKDSWRRRFALATAAALNQKGRSMPEASLRVCAELVRDELPMIRKALGWVLREACKGDRELVYRFLVRHRAVLHSSVLREASVKLDAQQREALLGR